MRQEQNVWRDHNTLGLPEVRCPHCHRLLFKGRVIQIEIKCPKCHCCYFVDYSGRHWVCEKDEETVLAEPGI